MSRKHHENELIRRAADAVGEEEVLAAGLFGCQDLVVDQVVGGTTGAIVGGSSPAGSALGAALGGFVARKAAAAAQGMTLKLIVAVGPERVHVLNWGDRDEDREVATFERASTEATVKKMGLSRILTLVDQTTGAHLALHGAVGPLAVNPDGVEHVISVLS